MHYVRQTYFLFPQFSHYCLLLFRGPVQDATLYSVPSLYNPTPIPGDLTVYPCADPAQTLPSPVRELAGPRGGWLCPYSVCISTRVFATVVDTYPYAFVTTHKMYETKSEP